MSTILRGRPWPLGSSLSELGVNFSVAAPGANRVELLLFESGEAASPCEVIDLEGDRHRSGDYWHVELPGLQAGCCYGYRVFGALAPGGHGFHPGKVLLDPCARAIDGWSVYERGAATGASPNTDCCLKGVVCERNRFDFDAHPRPRHSWQNTVIYELHVGGFTKAEDSGVAAEHRGSLLGVIDKIPYLKSLGVTTIELLPVQAFDPQDAPPGRDNVWGYSPLSWFAPHQGYVCGDDPLLARDQMRALVAACHDAGLEVLLDVVYNHTTEGNSQGPTLSWRGFADRTYYHQNDKGQYLDVSGCGNSIAAHQPISRELILESLRCWALELGVDGFRFDLGIALSRGEGLKPLDKPALFEAMEADPLLSELKLVSEPWDCGGLYRLNDFPAQRIGTWNGRFRDALRSFWKGDDDSTWALAQRLRSSPDLYDGKAASLGRSINLLTAHDGFTQTKACIDYHLAAFTGRGIGGKQNPGDVSGDHLLYYDRHGNRTLFDLVFMAIADGLCGPERGPTIQHGRNQRIVTFDVKIGVLLSGKGQSRQIFGVCGGSDGNRWFVPERRVSVAQLPSDII